MILGSKVLMTLSDGPIIIGNQFNFLIIAVCLLPQFPFSINTASSKYGGSGFRAIACLI